MNILDFERWSGVVKEGFNAKIEDDEDAKDEIEIDTPNEDNTIKYVVDGDDVKSKKQISTINKNGQQKNVKDESENIEDKNLKKDIIKATHSINKIKDRIKAKELDRLTGGDLTASTMEIIKVLNKESNPDVNSVVLYDTLTTDFFNVQNKGVWKYLNISNIKSKYDFEKNVIYNIAPKGIGRGEYLLPLLFNDVYKETVHGENTKGDNYIIHDDIKYNLELKGTGASLKFYDGITDTDDNDKIELYKNIITYSILRYAKNQQRKDRKNLYMCFFYTEGEKPNETPINALFINISNLVQDDLKVGSKVFNNLKELIDISNEQIKDNDFTFTYNGDDKNPKLICKVNKKYHIHESKTTILSRDNFINEIYTK